MILGRETNTMTSTWNVGSPSLIAYGVLTICIGMALSAAGTFMTNPMREELGYLLAEVFTGFCLVIASVFLGVMRARTESNRNVAIYRELPPAAELGWLARAVLGIVVRGAGVGVSFPQGQGSYTLLLRWDHVLVGNHPGDPVGSWHA